MSGKAIMVFVLLGILLQPAAAFAANWRWMGSTDTAGYYVDVDSLKTSAYLLEDARIEGWFKIEYVPPKQLRRGQAEYVLKKIRYTVPRTGDRISCNVDRISYYGGNSNIYDIQSVCPSAAFQPQEEDELCFAAFVDYTLGTDQQWLAALKADDRWLGAASAADYSLDVWIDQYTFSGDSAIKTATFNTLYYYRDEERYDTRSEKVDVRNKKLNNKEAIPESVGEGIVEKSVQLMSEPTMNMKRWKDALLQLRAVLKKR